MGASKNNTSEHTEKQQQTREALKESPEAHRWTQEHKEHTWGLPSSPTDATETYSFASLCFFNTSATLNLTLFPAALHLFCKHTYKPCDELVIPHPTPSPGQPI